MLALVYHGPVVYAEDPDGRLESASSALEPALLRGFMTPAAHRGQREYPFAVWADGEPGRDPLDLTVSPALVEHPGSSRVRVLLETPLAVRTSDDLAAALRRRGPAADLRETAAVRAAVEPWGRRSIRWTVKCRRDAAAAAWHAESVVRFCCSTYRGAIAAVRATRTA